VFTIGFGYVSLLLLGATLVVGPLNLLRRRRNPVNIMLRRDMGIWAGITGCLHVVFALQLYHNGEIISYFVETRPDGGFRLATGLSGVSNYMGLIATVLLVVLLVTSNNLSLRKLKGKPWKALQHYNYVLGTLAILHTYGYQVARGREMEFRVGALALAIVVLAAQFLGLMLYTSWRQIGAYRARKAHVHDFPS
jgi:sulfoxide reductase heme-binding subunit YedZ